MGAGCSHKNPTSALNNSISGMHLTFSKKKSELVGRKHPLLCFCRAKILIQHSKVMRSNACDAQQQVSGRPWRRFSALLTRPEGHGQLHCLINRD